MIGVVMLCFFVSMTAFAVEPECSPFHYEEKTLEKMIKLEIFVQKMKDDIDAAQRRVLSTLQDLAKEREQWKLDWENGLETMKNDFKEMKEVNKAEMKQHAKEIENLKESGHVLTVAFAAKKATSLKVNSEQVIIFEETNINHGHGYDNSTGIFTAQKAGMYFFTMQFCVGGEDGLGLALIANDVEIKRARLYDASDNNCYTSDALSILNNGDRVWIKCTDAATLLTGGNWWNTFSGVLLNKHINK